MAIIEDAYFGLYDRFPDFKYELNYSNKFRGYNGNVRRRGNFFEFNLSKQWEPINKEIQIGLIQELMVKILKDRKKNTPNMEMYNIFLQKIHIAVEKNRIDPVLKESFDRVNEKYFNGIIEMPNLVWGSFAKRKLGSYEYGTDKIVISSMLANSEIELLDYVMYHEMLHKYHKFKFGNGKNRHHTSEFRKSEKKFVGSELMEKRLRKLIQQTF